MTAYTPEDLENGWEFKIVRSASGAFRKAEKLQQLIEEEARAGWIMLEKFDDLRVRFKRPVRMREKDDSLPPDVDPYRTHFGMAFATYRWIAAGAVVALGAGLIIALLCAM